MSDVRPSASVKAVTDQVYSGGYYCTNFLQQTCIGVASATSIQTANGVSGTSDTPSYLTLPTTITASPGDAAKAITTTITAYTLWAPLIQLNSKPRISERPRQQAHLRDLLHRPLHRPCHLLQHPPPQHHHRNRRRLWLCRKTAQVCRSSYSRSARVMASLPSQQTAVKTKRRIRHVGVYWGQKAAVSFNLRAFAACA
jgi:hypothetical protein